MIKVVKKTEIVARGRESDLRRLSRQKDLQDRRDRNHREAVAHNREPHPYPLDHGY
jgi:hypothetical protein